MAKFRRIANVRDQMILADKAESAAMAEPALLPKPEALTRQ